MDRILIILKKENGPRASSALLIILKKENGPRASSAPGVKYHNIQICLLVYEADLR